MWPASTIDERLGYLEAKGWKVKSQTVPCAVFPGERVQHMLWTPDGEAVVEIPMLLQDRALHLLLDQHRVPNVGE